MLELQGKTRIDRNFKTVSMPTERMQVGIETDKAEVSFLQCGQYFELSAEVFKRHWKYSGQVKKEGNTGKTYIEELESHQKQYTWDIEKLGKHQYKSIEEPLDTFMQGC